MPDSKPASKFPLPALLARVENRGFLAQLRRLLSDTTEHQGLLALGHAGIDFDDPAKTVAGLFGLHPKHSEKGGNFGTTCRHLAVAIDPKASPGTAAGEDNPFNRHFRRLLACRTQADACIAIRRVVRHAKSKDIPINYARLYSDLRYWNNEIRQNWTRSYFSSQDPATEKPTAK